MKKIFGLMALGMLAACGGGSAGGGGSTHWKDELGNDNFMPDLGENDVVTFDFAGKAEQVNDVFYSPTDPDLVVVHEHLALWAGRISTGKLDPYCGPTLTTYPLRHEPAAGFFTLKGDQLIFYAPSISTSLPVPRFVCSHDAIISMDAPAGGPPVTQNLSRTAVPVDDGFWDLVATPGLTVPAQVVHLTYDGTIETMPVPMGTTQAVADPERAAYFFLAGTDVVKLDVKTKQTSTVATGIMASAMPKLAGAFAEGVVLSGAPAQLVVFAKGTTPIVTDASADAALGRNFFETDGKGVAIGGTRYDAETGKFMHLGYVTPPATPISAGGVTPSGHVYVVTGGLHELSLWTAPTASNDVTFDLAKPDVQLTPYPVEVSTSNHTLGFTSYADGTCVITTGSGQGGVPGGKSGTVADVVGSNRTLSVTKCGSKTARTILVGAAGAEAPSDFLSLVRRPFFTGLQMRLRATRCDECAANPYETPDLSILESAWTLTPDAEPKPLYKQAGGAWPRPRTLDNFIVRHDDKLVVVAGTAR